MRYRLVFDTSQVNTADTVTFYYTSSVHFISNSCGYTNYYNLDSVHSTKNVLDSISVVNPAVTNNQTLQAKHVLLYFSNKKMVHSLSRTFIVCLLLLSGSQFCIAQSLGKGKADTATKRIPLQDSFSC